MTEDLKDIVVLVTGASRGIGREIARQFLARGAMVAVHFNRNRKAAEETVAEFSPGRHLLIQADLSDPAAPQGVIEEAVKTFGRLDVLVNNAGLHIFHPPLDTTFEDWQDSWERILATNLMGPAHLTYFASRQMIKQGGGKIINITSRGAFRGEPKAPAYGASKAGLNAFSQSMAQALAPHNVFVYAVAPGFVETDMAAGVLNGPGGEAVRAQSPLNRAGRPSEVAKAVLFLAGEGPEYMTGCIIDVNGASYLRT